MTKTRFAHPSQGARNAIGLLLAGVLGFGPLTASAQLPAVPAGPGDPLGPIRGLRDQFQTDACTGTGGTVNFGGVDNALAGKGPVPISGTLRAADGCDGQQHCSEGKTVCATVFAMPAVICETLWPFRVCTARAKVGGGGFSGTGLAGEAKWSGKICGARNRGDCNDAKAFEGQCAWDAAQSDGCQSLSELYKVGSWWCFWFTCPTSAFVRANAGATAEAKAQTTVLVVVVHEEVERAEIGTSKEEYQESGG